MKHGTDEQSHHRPLLIVPDGGGTAVTIPHSRPVEVGRSESCLVYLDHPQISRCHARIERSGAGWRLTDLGSRNGTFINDERLGPNSSVQIRDGDAVAFGPCMFRVRLPGRGGPLTTSDQFATRASIFVRLRDEKKDVRELGWEEFGQRYAPVIVGFARNAGLPPHDSEDVLQEVMMGFFRVVPEFRYDPSRGRFRGYLKQATLNVIRDRARGRRDTVIPPSWLEEQDAGAETAWEEQWAAQLLARAMDEARLRFDPATLEAFELYAQRGVPAQVVAQRLEMSVESVHQAKSRVLRFVRETVDRIRGEEG